VHDDDIGGHHCAMRFYDEFEKKAIEAKRTERRFRSQSRQRPIQERATALGKSVSEIYNSDLAASSEEDWVAIDAFEIRDVKVNYHVVIRGDREGNVSDGSLECTTRRLNLAFQNKDPTESIWNELKRQGTGACNLDVENIDKVLSDSEAFASFGEPSGISFKTNRIFRYAAICDGGPDDPAGCMDNSKPLPECGDDPRCLGADYFAPSNWFVCENQEVAPAMANRVVLTNPTDTSPDKHINIFSCEPTSGGSVTLGYVLCIAGDEFKNGRCPVGEADPKNAIFTLYAAFPGQPGVTLRSFDEADTVTHETGHFLGLWHVFGDVGLFVCPTGDCNDSGDFVCDTADIERPNFGTCAQNQGATDCSGVIVVGQEDNPLDSFMNYVDDQCMHRFSSEQVKRMQETVVMFKPTLCAEYGVGGLCVRRRCELSEWSQWSDCQADSCNVEDNIQFRSQQTGSRNVNLTPVQSVEGTTNSPLIQNQDSQSQRSAAITRSTVSMSRQNAVSMERTSTIPITERASTSDSSFTTQERVAVARTSALGGSSLTETTTLQSDGDVSGSRSGVEIRTRTIIKTAVGNLPEDQCQGELIETRECSSVPDTVCKCPSDRIGLIIELSLGGCASKMSVSVIDSGTENVVYRLAEGLIPSSETEAVISLCLESSVYFVDISARGCTNRGFDNGIEGCPGGDGAVGYKISKRIEEVEENIVTSCGSLESDSTVVILGAPTGCFGGPWGEFGPCISYCTVNSRSGDLRSSTLENALLSKDVSNSLLDDISNFARLNSSQILERSSEFQNSYQAVSRLLANERTTKENNVRVNVNDLCRFLSTDSRLPVTCLGYIKQPESLVDPDSVVKEIPMEVIYDIFEETDLDANDYLDATELNYLLQVIGHFSNKSKLSRNDDSDMRMAISSLDRIGQRTRQREVIYSNMPPGTFCSILTFQTEQCETGSSDCIREDSSSPSPSPSPSPFFFFT